MGYTKSGNRPSARVERQLLADIPAQIAALKTMSGKELQAKYREIYGEPCRSSNTAYLRKKIAWRIQEMAEGGLSERAQARIAELGRDAPIRLRPTPATRAAVAAILEVPTTPEQPKVKPRDPRLPAPGTILRREHQGTVHEVTVLDDGFEYGGERYKSLSKIARTITGTPWNGWLFFGLTTRRKPSETQR